MANSTTNLDLIASGQSQKEITANALSDALSTAALFGRRASTSAALSWGYYGGNFSVAGEPTQIANGVITLTASMTNYIYATSAGVVTKTTSAPVGWPGPLAAGAVALYEIVVGASAVTSYIDYRTQITGTAGIGSVTSVGLSVPSFLSVGGSPVASAGTLAVTYSGTPLPQANGGTGATTEAGARTALGLAIGTDVQAWNADLDAISGLTSAANKIPYYTGAHAAALLTRDTDGTLAGNSDTALATQKAVKTYADAGNAASLATAKAYADGLVVGLWDDRGSYDASGNAFPSSGGSGTAGAILKGDIWTISVAGTLGGTAVAAGDLVRALVDTPGSTAGNWALTEHDIGYTAENSSNKNASGGYAGLTLFKLNLRNAANTITSWFTTAATVARTWTMPDKDGTVAMLSDITGTNSGTNTGDETSSSIAAIDHAAALKATPVDADEINLLDSAASFALKRLTFTNLKAFLKTYFDTLYGSGFAGGTLTSALNEAPAVTIASSTTPAIFAAAGNTINMSGTTTVAGFDTIAAGAVRRVVFGGILQLTYNATSMQNLTTANITTAAGDIAEFESLGSGNTKMIAYTRADGTALASSGGGSATSITGTTGATGGDATATGGTSTTSANVGGKVIILGGTPGATGVGGAVNITGGPGGSSAGAGGALVLKGGVYTANPTNPYPATITLSGAVSANAGSVSILGGDGLSSAGGAITIKGGNNTFAATGGAVSITAGDGVGTGAAVSVTGGSGAGGGGTGGALNLTGGAAGSAIGGAVNITGGAGGNTNGGGAVVLTGGAPNGATARGNVVLNGSGSALATTATGGFTCIPTCAGTPTGTPAVIPTGTVPMVYDTVGAHLWVYTSGAWVLV